MAYPHGGRLAVGALPQGLTPAYLCVKPFRDKGRITPVRIVEKLR